MPWEVKHLPDKEVVALICSGRFSSNDAREQAEEVIHLLKENKATRVLLDYSNAIGEVPIVDLFYLPEHYDKLGAPKNARVALVLPKTEHRLEDYGFYETVCRNKGYNCTLFRSHQAALKWLEQGETA